MNPLRITGLACLAIAAVMLLLDLLLGFTDPTWQGISMVRLWGIIGPGSLVALERFVEGSLSATLWNGVLAPFLSLPVWLAFLILGIGLTVTGRSSD